MSVELCDFVISIKLSSLIYMLNCMMHLQMKIQIDWAGASRRDIQMTVLTEKGALEWTIGLLQPRLPQTRHSSLGRTVHHNGRPDFIDNVAGPRVPPWTSSTTVSCRTIVGRFGAIKRLREPK